MLSIKIPRPIFEPNRHAQIVEEDQQFEEQQEKLKEITNKKLRDKGRHRKPQEPVDDIRYYSLPEHFGSVFVEFLTDSDAFAAKRGLAEMAGIGEPALKLGGRLVDVRFWDYDNYLKMNYRSQ